MAKKIMLGNEAFARGAWEAGVKVISSYPGTPSTEVTETAAKFEEIHVEWAPNEKVGVEVAMGASIGGVRSLSCMKHVGLNVAADPFFTAAYTGVTGGAVVLVADDNGCHSSQNEQDSRYYGRSAGVPVLEPSTSQECKDYIMKAYEMSEKYDTVVLMRSNTRVSHSERHRQAGREDRTRQDPVCQERTEICSYACNGKKAPRRSGKEDGSDRGGFSIITAEHSGDGGHIHRYHHQRHMLSVCQRGSA
ncbi:MAG: hypothetical protein V8Q42_08520 [Anaerovoracaceae bacterium]